MLGEARGRRRWPSKQPDGGFKSPVKAEDWKAFWKPGEWNELRARVEGNPPKLTTWIKGVKFMEYQDTERRLEDKGGIALQVHGGIGFTKDYKIQLFYRRQKRAELAFGDDLFPALQAFVDGDVAVGAGAEEHN